MTAGDPCHAGKGEIEDTAGMRLVRYMTAGRRVSNEGRKGLTGDRGAAIALILFFPTFNHLPDSCRHSTLAFPMHIQSCGCDILVRMASPDTNKT